MNPLSASLVIAREKVPWSHDIENGQGDGNSNLTGQMVLLTRGSGCEYSYCQVISRRSKERIWHAAAKIRRKDRFRKKFGASGMVVISVCIKQKKIILRIEIPAPHSEIFIPHQSRERVIMINRNFNRGS